MPALALARALLDARAGVEPVLVGAVRGIESQVLPRYPFRFQLLPLEPVYRRTWWRNVRWPAIAWRAWRAAGGGAPPPPPPHRDRPGGHAPPPAGRGGPAAGPP